ncbi:hypothetical protein [Thalassoglobus sp.]|uniref:hypothetical protein n=1 Tax=Thalassoglobus sp. TaxID=2795869 RepID=UPI003AA8F9E6
MTAHHYTFTDNVAMHEVEASLLLSIWATESLHGESQVRLDAAHVLDEDERSLVIDSDTNVGCDLNRILIGFLRREFRATDFEVRRCETPVAASV